MDSKALITGITGQDGYYLANLLLEKGYEVHGTIRRSSSINTSRIDGLISKFQNKGLLKLHYADLTDSSSISTLVSEIMPDEVYNLGAQSHVAVSLRTLSCLLRLEISVHYHYLKQLNLRINK